VYAEFKKIMSRVCKVRSSTLKITSRQQMTQCKKYFIKDPINQESFPSKLLFRV
jgi:hypothetical protein